MTTIRLTANDGGQCVTAANIHAIRDGAGVLFWTCQEGYSGQSPQQVVYRVDATGQHKVPLEKTVTGRGQLSIIDGALYLNAWNEAEGKVGYLIPVPGWTPYPAAAGVDLGPIQQRLTQIETALGNIGGGSLSERYTQALERLCAFFGL